MTDKTFSYKDWDVLVQQAVENIQFLAKSKGGEYTDGQDRLSNFRRNGNALGLRMEQIWAVYAGKHWDAITTYIRDMGTGTLRVRTEPIAGRVDDMLTYLLLFKAMLVEAGEIKLNEAPPEQIKIEPLR